MNKASLPIFARLQALQTKAGFNAGGARIIAAAGHANPLAALLCEVNETVLGRTLTFDSSSGASLSLEVSGRRVLRAVEANDVSDEDGCLQAESLEFEHKDGLIKLMQGVATPGHELRVWALPMAREVDGVSVGLPVALLADLTLIDLNPHAAGTAPDPTAPPRERTVSRTLRPVSQLSSPFTERPVTEFPRPSSRFGVTAPPAPAAERSEPVAPEVLPGIVNPAASEAPFLGIFAREFGPELMAWLIVGGEGNGAADGPEEMVSHLYGFLKDEKDALNIQLDKISDQQRAPVCIILGATLIEGHSIVCARGGTGVLLGLVEGDATQPMLRAWASALRG